MADPTTTPTPTATAESVTVALDHFRQRAADLHAAADRAETTRYAQRGSALDDATRAAGSARQEADTARQQAQHERDQVLDFDTMVRDLTELAARPGTDTRFAQQQIQRHQALSRAAEQRAERLEQAAEQSGARADELAEQVTQLRQAAGDETVAGALREAATKMDTAVDQYAEKVRLLGNAESLEREAAELDARGESIDAGLYREQVAEVRARADAIVPEVPEVDPRLVAAADLPGGPEDAGPPADAAPGAPGAPITPITGEPVDPYDPATPGNTGTPGDSGAPGTPGNTGTPGTPGDSGAPGAPGNSGTPGQPAAGRPGDADGDGLSDAFERELGTNVNRDDTDRDGWVDGIEVAVGAHNPRVAEYDPLDPEEAAEAARMIAEMERSRGRTVGDDSDDDGVANWIESLGGFTKDPNLTADDIVHNLSPLDQFVKNAQDQVGKPYRFGSEVDPADRDGGASYDSSELVEWAAKQAGVRDMPDGSWNQYKYLHDAGASVPVAEALQTKGALVFGFSSDPTLSSDRPARAYVGISLGDGKVLDVSERAGEVRVMEPGGFYTYGAKIPALHNPTGDLDGDGWTDQEEQSAGGDPSRGISSPRSDVLVPDDDPADPAAPATPGAGVDPLGPGARPVAPAAALTDDPTGQARYRDPDHSDTGYSDTGYDGQAYDGAGGSAGPGPADGTGYDDPGYNPSSGGTGYDDPGYDPSPGGTGYGDPGYGPSDGDAPAQVPAPAAPSSSDSYGDSYDDTDQGASYDDSYGDLSTSYD